MSSQNHFPTKVTPSLQLTYSYNIHGVGIKLKKKWNLLHKNRCCGQVILLYLSFITMAAPKPLGRSEVSLANGPCFYFSLSTQCWGNDQTFDIPRQLWQCKVKITGCGEKPVLVLPVGYPRSVGVLAGNGCRKCQSPPFIPRAGREMFQMTSA